MIAGLLTEQKVADVDHLRWDLRQVFDMVVAYRAEPCSLAVHAKRSGPIRRVMNLKEVNLFRCSRTKGAAECEACGDAGMRPGEIVALTWARLKAPSADILQRVYRGAIFGG